jgi:hypothetical protein
MFTRRLGWLGVFVALAAVGSGLLLAQSPQEVGTWVGVGSADNPFGNGAHVDMGDGRTLIVGGTAPDGAATNVVASFDTATNQFTVAGTLLTPRTEHTATLLKDGRVLVTGGTTNALVSTDIEIFDPSTGASTLVAQMAEPRRGHVAALLQSGSVVIAGGYTTENAVLQSAFVFDPAINSVSPTPSGMNVARASASATSLIDGRVVIIGGTDGTNDLRSAEIYDQSLQTFTATSTQLSVPVHGHSAVLLPHNGSVLVAGGTSNGVAQAGADLFLPAIFPDPFSWGVGQFAPTAAMSTARSSAIAGPSATEGYAVATGGGSNGVERYRFATIKTDKDDYPPGQTAIITGSGWQPNEEVTLLFQEDPAVHDDYVLTVTADSEGNIRHDQWAPEEHDANVRFYLMAIGQQSGRRAQMTFTDSVTSVTITSPTNASPVTVTSLPATIPVNFNYVTSPTGTTVVTAEILGTSGSASEGLTPGTHSGSTVVTLPVGTSNGSYNLKVTVTNTFGIGSNSKNDNQNSAVIVNVATNVAPSVAFTTAPTTANEGDTKTYNFSITDSDTGQTFTFASGFPDCGTGGTLGSSSINSASKTGTFQCSFPDGPANPTVRVQVQDSFSTPANSNIATVNVVVSNVAPQVVLSGDTSANEGDTKTYTYTVTDLGDPNPTITESCGANGIKTDTPAPNSFDCTFPDGPASSMVEVTANDGDPSDNVGSFSNVVNVANVAPTVVLTGLATANEGDTQTYTYTVTDPGNDPNPTIIESCGAFGTRIDTATANSFDCTFPDGPAMSMVLVTANDHDPSNNLGTGSIDVDVANVAPVVDLSGQTSANEGDTKTYTYTVTDPGDDPNPTIIESCGVNGTRIDTPAANSFDCTFPDGPASSTAQVTADDHDPSNNNGTDSITVTVANLNPTATLSNNGPINEGGSATISFGNQADASSVDVTAGFRYAYSCSGSAIGITTYAAASSSASTSCAFGDNGSMTVRGRIFDKDSGYTDYVTYVVVNNVAPSNTGNTFSFNPYTGIANASISFSDPGWLDTVSATWAGVLPGANPISAGPRATPGLLTDTFIASNTFTGCVASAIGVRVSDDDGGYFDYQFAPANSLGTYTASFLAPIKDGARNIVKLGNVIPVKIQVLDCNGNAVLNRTLTVLLVSGTDASETWYGDNLTDGTSVSSADTGNQMRIADGHYMYNLATKGLKTGVPFTIIIRDTALPAGSQNIATAAIELKK